MRLVRRRNLQVVSTLRLDPGGWRIRLPSERTPVKVDNYEPEPEGDPDVDYDAVFAPDRITAALEQVGTGTPAHG